MPLILLLNDGELCHISKSRGPPKLSNLLQGAIVTNPHVYHIGTLVPSPSFSVCQPQPWLTNQQDSHLS